MWTNAHDAYLESKVLSADPVELIRMLYQACTSAVREARQHLANGEIRGRSRSITKARNILAELTIALDHKRGGEISRRLAELYDYMMRRLNQANFEQSEAPLAEVLGLLATLTEAWDGVQQQIKAACPAGAETSRWPQPAHQEAAPGYSSQSWSF
jgi:flagellar protein FliS